MNSPRYRSAICRNLAELQRAILLGTTLVGIESVKGVYHYFLYVTYTGLFNDYIAHCIKVFEQNKRVAPFWYVYRTNEKPIKAFAQSNKIDLAALEAVSHKLKLIRNKTHFHIDKDSVLKPKAIWAQAGLAGKELANAVDAAWKILTHLQQIHGLPKITLPNDTVADAKAAAEWVGRK